MFWECHTGNFCLQSRCTRESILLWAIAHHDLKCQASSLWIGFLLSISTLICSPKFRHNVATPSETPFAFGGITLTSSTQLALSSWLASDKPWTLDHPIIAACNFPCCNASETDSPLGILPTCKQITTGSILQEKIPHASPFGCMRCIISHSHDRIWELPQ